VRKRGLLDAALEGLCPRARDVRRAPGAWAGAAAWRALGGKAMDPLAQRGIGQRPGVGDGVEALALDDVAHGWGTAEAPSRCGLFQARVYSGEGVIGQVQCEGAPEQGLQHTGLQKCTTMAPHILCVPA
jgi:hypothetical protein